jgi:hypothetical protein
MGKVLRIMFEQSPTKGGSLIIIAEELDHFRVEPVSSSGLTQEPDCESATVKHEATAVS